MCAFLRNTLAREEAASSFAEAGASLARADSPKHQKLCKYAARTLGARHPGLYRHGLTTPLRAPKQGRIQSYICCCQWVVRAVCSSRGVRAGETAHSSVPGMGVVQMSHVASYSVLHMVYSMVHILVDTHLSTEAYALPAVMQ